MKLDKKKQLLELEMARVRVKKFTSKQLGKQMHFNTWQQDGPKLHVLRDYKTFFLGIALTKDNTYDCLFSGARMSHYAAYVGKYFADCYASLDEAKESMLNFIDLYNNKIAADHVMQLKNRVDLSADSNIIEAT